jgi:twinkle protein
MSLRPESELTASKLPCPCGKSSDAYATYSDGHGYCYSCGDHHRDAGEVQSATPKKRMSKDLIQDGYFSAIRSRGITEETCRKFGYQLVDDFKGRPAQVAPYHTPEGVLVGQKVRSPDKSFCVLGTIKEAGLFGQHIHRSDGKWVVVTEGEVDALSVSQALGNKWPVVSVPNGAQGARKALAAQLQWLLGFEHVILWFDDDEPGRAAVEDCASLFPPGRCKVARLSGYKDANDALRDGKAGDIVSAVWGARTWRPDGILSGPDLWDRFQEECDDSAVSVELPWLGLQQKTLGLRRGELWTFTAGSGIGKSAIVRELAHHLLREGEAVGMLMLEENVSRTLKGLIGIELSRPMHLDTTPWRDMEDADRKERREAFERIGGGSRLHLYDHFGSTDTDNLINRIRFMVTSLGCSWIILDHLSIVVSGNDDGDERKTIDVLMTKLRTLVQETKCGLLLVSHLKRPSGDKGHENGAETSLSQLRGSHAIAQLSDAVIGAERDQQAETETERAITTLRVLKMRFTGDTGIATHLLYDRETGRLREVDLNSILADAKDKAAQGSPFKEEF